MSVDKIGDSEAPKIKNPLFRGGLGQYNGVPEEQVKAISNMASVILNRFNLAIKAKAYRNMHG